MSEEMGWSKSRVPHRPARTRATAPERAIPHYQHPVAGGQEIKANEKRI